MIKRLIERFKKKPKVAEAVVVRTVEHHSMVMVDMWYYDEELPNILQSWTWQTVDTAPDFPRCLAWVSAMSESCTIHHWQIREFNRPVPLYQPSLVYPVPLSSN